MQSHRDLRKLIPGTTYFPEPLPAEYHRRRKLNCRIRDGNGCFLTTIRTGEFLKHVKIFYRGEISVVYKSINETLKNTQNYLFSVIKTFDLLVPVSLTRYRASTPGLSTL